MRNVVENLANDSVRCVCDEFAGIRVEAGERGRRPGRRLFAIRGRGRGNIDEDEDGGRLAIQQNA